MSCICPVCGFPGLETAPRDSQDGPPHPAPHGNNMAPLFVSTSPGDKSLSVERGDETYDENPGAICPQPDRACRNCVLRQRCCAF